MSWTPVNPVTEPYPWGVVSAPVNILAPAVTGTASVGQALDCSSGSWSNGPVTLAYQWFLADADTPISGATSAAYILVAGDFGHTMECEVTATNSGGPGTAFSNITQAVSGPVPVNSVAPTLTGTAEVGSTLTSSTGAWSNSPTGYAYQWHWADTGPTISGATGSTYAPVSGDIGHTVNCVVTTTNTYGSANATSNATSAVIAGSGSPDLDFARASNSQYIAALAA